VQLDHAIARFDAVVGGDTDVLSHAPEYRLPRCETQPLGGVVLRCGISLPLNAYSA
jgi:hypothetical protein